MNKLWIVAKNIYGRRLKSAGFLTMVLSPLIFAVFVAVIYLVQTNIENASYGNIALVTKQEEVAATLLATDSRNEFMQVEDLDQAEDLLREDEVVAIMEVSSGLTGLTVDVYQKQGATGISLGAEEEALKLVQASQNMSNSPIKPSDLLQFMQSQVNLNQIRVTFDADSQQMQALQQNAIERSMRLVVAMVVVMLLFFLITFYVALIAEEIAKEKGSRVMEIILTSMSASDHFYGKILGILMLILTHFSIYIILIAAFVGLNQRFNWIDWSLITQFNLGALFKQQQDVLGWSLAFALLGLLIYTALSAFLGSLASSLEDVQKVNMPVIFLMIIGFYIGIFGIDSTTSPIVRIGSYIPFFTPYVMPFRIAAGTVTQGQLYLSIVISLVTVILSFKLSVSFYESNVLTHSDKGPLNNFKRSIAFKRNG